LTISRVLFPAISAGNAARHAESVAMRCRQGHEEAAEKSGTSGILGVCPTGCREPDVWGTLSKSSSCAWMKWDAGMVRTPGSLLNRKTKMREMAAMAMNPLMRSQDLDEALTETAPPGPCADGGPPGPRR